MIYPNFLKSGDTIGICAPSKGVNKEDKNFEKSLKRLKEEKYNIIETENTRTGIVPSSDAKTRAKELNELLKNPNVDFIYAAKGGDFLLEILPYIDEEIIKDLISQNKTKFVAGFSDPTSLLFYLTTKFDIATIYGTNADSFDQDILYDNLKNALSIIKGDIVKQVKFPKCERIDYTFKKEISAYYNGYILNKDTEWKNLNGDTDIKGRIIGGCIDCIKSMLGTKYDYINDFIERYKEDGIIWYFDNFALASDDLYYVLWQMRESGYFKYSKGFVFGRTLFEKELILTYEDAITRALGKEVPIVLNADIGHVQPCFTIINGSIGHFVSNKDNSYFEMELK